MAEMNGANGEDLTAYPPFAAVEHPREPMSDVGWGSDHLEAPKKRKIPLWLLGCGGGCMFFVGALAVAAIWVFPKAERWVGGLNEPEQQWPRVADVLPFDAPPQGFTIQRLPFPIVNLWQLESDSQDLYVGILSAPQDKEWGNWLSNPKEAPFFDVVQGAWRSEDGTLIVQGRELRCTRYSRGDTPSEPVEGPPQEPRAREMELEKGLNARPVLLGGGIGIDVTPEQSPRRILVWIFRRSPSGSVSDEEARQFLAPFQIGPGR